MGIFRRLSLALIGFSVLFSCTNVGLNQLNDRVNDNFTGAIAPPADIDPAGTDNFSFAVMGDTHVGSPGGGSLKEFAQLSVSAGDAFIVLSGDLTHGGVEGEYIQFKQVLTERNATWRAALGNHDLFFDGWSRFRTQIGRSIYSFNADNVHFVVLDSGNGVLGKKQLEWFEADLRANTRPHVVVVTHFPPWNGTFSSIYRMSSEEEAAIFKDICHRNGVDLVVSGHYHGNDEITLGNTRYIVSGGANGQTDPGQKSGFLRVRVNGAQMTVDYIFP